MLREKSIGRLEDEDEVVDVVGLPQDADEEHRGVEAGGSRTVARVRFGEGEVKVVDAVAGEQLSLKSRPAELFALPLRRSVAF
jgi:hypothetical protein